VDAGRRPALDGDRGPGQSHDRHGRRGGAIVAWHDIRSGTTFDIYAQKVNASGAPQWTADGAEVCTSASHQQFPTLTWDGAGGAIVTWFDLRTGNYDIYAQRIASGGAMLWTANGVAICTAAAAPGVSDDRPRRRGGAIITWFDQRTGDSYTFSDIYAQRVSSDGAVQWTAKRRAPLHRDGRPVESDDCDGRRERCDRHVVRLSQRQLRHLRPARRRDRHGAMGRDGVALNTLPGEQAYPTIVSDDAGGAIVTVARSRREELRHSCAADLRRGRDPVDLAGRGGLRRGRRPVRPHDHFGRGGGAIISWWDFRFE
jgi:hypothetical protein